MPLLPLTLLHLLQCQLQMWSMQLGVLYQVFYALHLCKPADGPIFCKPQLVIHNWLQPTITSLPTTAATVSMLKLHAAGTAGFAAAAQMS
jgi:hypothetical protein